MSDIEISHASTYPIPIPAARKDDFSTFIPTTPVIPSPIATLQSYLDPSLFIAQPHLLVAARVRPFHVNSSNGHDLSQRQVPCVTMTDSKITITNQSTSTATSSTESCIRHFRVDRHYWSHSDFQVDAKTGERTAAETATSSPVTSASSSVSTSSDTNTDSAAKYASQQSIYADLGPRMVSAVFAGKPSLCMVYGPTGSGKSYTVLGDQSNPGLVHRVAADLFATIELANAAPATAAAAATDSSSSSHRSDSHGDSGEGFNQNQVLNTEVTTTRYSVEFRMLESYLERVRDLLSPAVSVKELDNYPVSIRTDDDELAGLPPPVRVEGVAHFQRLIAQGLHNQLTTSPNPSRAHTLYELSLVKEETATVNGAIDSHSVRSSISRLTVADLAGCQRLTAGEYRSKFGSKEGCSIGASFCALGNVIAALDFLARGRKKVFVPYRHSCLTRILKKPLSLGSGNSFLVTLSPEAENFDETLSQLRVADQYLNSLK